MGSSRKAEKQLRQRKPGRRTARASADRHRDEADIVLLDDLLARVAHDAEDGSSLRPDQAPQVDEHALTPDSSEEVPGEEEFDLAPGPRLAGLDSDDTLGLYLKEVGHIPLLTKDQEVDLSKRIERGTKARQQLAGGGHSEKKRAELLQHVEDGWAAREHLLTANSRLVISVAKRYLGRGVPFSDLIQEGNIGLIRATKKFDYRRGHKFSTYATWWIRQAITRAIADQGRTIRVPVHMGDQINRLLRATHQMTQELGREPTISELAERLDIHSKKVEEMVETARRPLSLEAPTDDEEDATLGDFIRDDSASELPEIVAQNLLQEHLRQVLDNLPHRERRTIQLRYGLLDGQVHTLEEVGNKLGVTRERVRQIEAQAMRRLRNPSFRHKLVDYIRA
jgi:RNA polymerase primary sigma factor